MKTAIKTIKIIPLFLLLAFSMTSCLKEDLPEYPLWDGNQITNVYVEHRFNSTQEYHGDPVVAFQQLGVQETIDEASGTILIDITVPNPSGEFSEEIREQVNQNNLWMYVDISTAATITPTNGTPKLGDPMDLTQPQIFEVIAANGDVKTWTIELNSFTK